MVPLATLIFRRNPLAQADRQVATVPAGTRPIDWLLEHYPPERGGAGGRVEHWHNKVRIDYDDDDYLDRPMAAGDCVELAIHVAEAVSITTIIVTAVVTAVVTAAVSLGLSLLFPDPTAPQAAVPETSNAPQSPVYNVRSRQNLARLGEPVPVVYGNVLMTPDLCSAPYNFFDSPRGMHVDLLLCLGHGDFQIHEVLVGETETTSLSGADYIVVTPAEHGGTFGTLAAIAAGNGWSPGFVENAWTSLEVGEQRLTEAGDAAGYFRVGRAGVSEGRYLYINIEWPRGLYNQPDWDGTTTVFVDWKIQVQQIDENGNAIAGVEEHPFTQGGASRDPLRATYQVDLGRYGAWLVRLERITTHHPTVNDETEFYWRGLMLDCTHDRPQAYGWVTLVMVRLKAEAIARTAERLVRVRCTRKLAPMGNPVNPIAPTASPADAFIDMLTNQVYGARRPLTEVDYNRIALLRTYWLPYEFNAAYTARTTVWEALAQAVQGVAAAPLPIGGYMSVAQDGIRPARSMMFSEQNIVRGSFSLSYHFDQTGAADGIEIEYVDPQTWAPAYERWPASSLVPDRMNLFGCASPQHAAEYARLQWQRRLSLRRLVEFQTELEGLIPYPAERIAVAHSLPRWGASGFVARVEADGVTVELDRALPWDEFAAPHYMMFRNEHSGASNVVAVTMGFNGAAWAVLASSPWGPEGGWVIGARQEGTQFAFGDAEMLVKDFTLTALAPRGGSGATTVTVSGVIYDPDVYFGAMAFLQFPVP